jgi:methionine biosynthesis protein MetW
MSLKDFYNQYWQERGLSKGVRLRYKIFLDWVNQGSTVLDLAGGDGHLGEILQEEKKCQVTVMDISQVAIETAKKRGLEAMLGNLEDKLPFNDNSFDTVILSEVLEHIVNSENVLKEARRVTKKNILVSIPNTGFYKYRLQLLFGRFPKQWLISPVEHLRFWTQVDFLKTLKDLNFILLKKKASAGRRLIRDFYPKLFAEQICFKLKK